SGMNIPSHDLELAQAPPGELVRAALERILASEGFTGSAQLSRFLRHIVEESLSGAESDLKESVIGVKVFNRGLAYDPKADPIVRVEARRLRARLDGYYQKNRTADAVRISLPKGGYVPSFEIVQPAETISVPLDSPAARQPFSRRTWMLLLLSAAAMAIVAAIVYQAQEPAR